MTVTYTGVVVHDLELEYIAEEDYGRESAYTATTRFEVQDGTSVVTVTARSRLAENVVESVRAGDEVIVVGVIVTTEPGLAITARNVGVSLRSAIAQPHRTTYQRIAIERGVA